MVDEVVVVGISDARPVDLGYKVEGTLHHQLEEDLALVGVWSLGLHGHSSDDEILDVWVLAHVFKFELEDT